MRSFAGLHVKLRALPFVDVFKNLSAIRLDVAGKQSRFLGVLHQFLQRAARPHDLRRQIVHADIAAITENNAALCVEHAQALRHVVECVRQPAILHDQAAVPNAYQCQRGDAQCREQQRLAGDGRWNNGRKHAGPDVVLRGDLGGERLRYG
jgi:hypothetical protein